MSRTISTLPFNDWYTFGLTKRQKVPNGYRFRLTLFWGAEILVSRAEAKADHLQLAGKVDKIAKDHTRRLETLEEKTETPNPHKH